ncbi:MAG: cyclic peptide export ABC transporter [Elainellaceae cyanobacterium]
MHLILFLLRSSWQMVAIAILTGFLSGGSSAGLIAFVSWVAGQDAANRSLLLLAGFVGLAGVALLTNIISQLMLIRLAQRAIFQLRLSLSQQILASELAHLEELGTPRLLATLTEDVQAIAEAVRLMPFICIDLATVAGCLLFITLLSWNMALFVCGLAAFTIAIYRLFLKRARVQLALAREDQDQLFRHFRSTTDGVKELKLHYQRRQAFLNEDLTRSAADYRRHNVKGLSLFTVIVNFGNLILFFALGLVVFALPQLFTVSPQIISTYLLTFTYMIMPMQELVSRLPILSRASVSLSKIDSLNLSLSEHAETLSVPDPALVNWQSLVLQGVTHRYHTGEESSFMLGPIDLSFRPGELVLIVGGNGSGKSTLAKLITGLYQPDSGEIWLGNQRITPENREWYRQHFAAIFSDFYLFDRLLGFDLNTIAPQVQGYLKQLQLDHKVKIENGRFSTTALSQGQRKRLALLTAYLEDRPIYLFDEWAADQDPGFKELFYTQFLPELRDRGKTVLVISHDDRYFHVADRLIKLDYGKVEYEKHR